MKNIALLLLLVTIVACGGSGENKNNDEKRTGKIVLTFDDTWVDNWEKYSYIIDSRSIPATFFVSRYGDSTAPFNTRNPDSVSILHSLQQRGHEIASHTLKHLRVRDFVAEFGEDAWINEEVLPALCNKIEDGFSVYSFAYPNSNSNSVGTDSRLSNIFGKIRLFDGSDNTHLIGINKNENKIILSTGIDEQFLNMSELKKVISNVSQTGGFLVLTAHDITDGKESGLYIKPTTLQEIVDYSLSLGLEFITVKEMFGSSSNKIEFEDFCI
ncbi:polysaccharide deacetylase [Alishewanella agri BL06]|uniref:Polysaccharide deacetylase n=1 Tax=Alishewanella agri BL06 TaxID=1195246 RepID=I9P244_9ALTE|nr:polysaccharide deacetylase family protein [Alishewanella agri]EIW88834.1 polysaccharide deacetylase [Alishewanella agri BL06]